MTASLPIIGGGRADRTTVGDKRSRPRQAHDAGGAADQRRFNSPTNARSNVIGSHRMERGFPILLIQQTTQYRDAHPNIENPACITFSNFPYNTIKYSMCAPHQGISKPLAGKTKLTDHPDQFSQPTASRQSLAKILRQCFYRPVLEEYISDTGIIRESDGALAKYTASNTRGYWHGC